MDLIINVSVNRSEHVFALHPKMRKQFVDMKLKFLPRVISLMYDEDVTDFKATHSNPFIISRIPYALTCHDYSALFLLGYNTALYMNPVSQHIFAHLPLVRD